MPKLHMRLSVELNVTDEQLTEIVDTQLKQWKQCCDVEYAELPGSVQAMIDRMEFTPCDWDDGGYVPQDWLEFDAVDSQLYDFTSSKNERGMIHDQMIRKENA